MIISRLEGGLGNQMFQYAFGLYAAKESGTELLLDTSSYRARPQHGFLLDRFCIKTRICDEGDQEKIPARYRSTPQGPVTKLLSRMRIDGSLSRFKEKPFGFQPKYLEVEDHCYLVGNWQSEKYFPGMRSQLLAELQPSAPLTPETREVAKRIAGTRSLALHIRRGDYISDASAASIYEHLSLEYYRECARRFADEGPPAEVFVFSNDIEWCQRSLQLPWKTTFVNHTDASSAHEDLWLMSQAGGIGIANSTFSWWSAWLNQRSDLRVYAPQNWFRVGTLDDEHIVCEGWTKVFDQDHGTFQRAA